MKRIVFVPLDERPCNSRFPCIMPNAGFELTLPPRALMGAKKRPADTEKLAEWLLRAAEDADAFVLSMDTLVYGGLIPSRLHRESRETLYARADILRRLRAVRPDARIYAFETIMRCPFYSLSDEEPEYYAQYGAEIHLYGKYLHRERLGLADEREKAELVRIKAAIPAEVLADYTERRAVNLDVLTHVLGMVETGVVNSFIVPQDDSAPYGFTALDQERVRRTLEEKRLLMKVPVYPAADDTGLTLLARAANEAKGVRPKVFVHYACARGPLVVPSFEDRSADATVNSQIRAAGCARVFSLPECDIVLAVNIAAEMFREGTREQTANAYDVERNLPAFVDFLSDALAAGKIVAVADVAYPSHSDLELMDLMHDEGLLFRIHAYAGWNTCSNTIGTVLAESCLYLAGGDQAGNEYFLLHRYYDDVGYCSHTRTYIDINAVPAFAESVFVLDGENGRCAAAAREELLRFMQARYPRCAARVKDLSLTLPWNRTFEADLVLELRTPR